MTANEIRSKYIDFFRKRKHKEILPAPIVPPEDPTTLFTSSGMQQLVPFLKGEPHPMGKRLVDSQPCFRAEDIDEIGDNRHTTFFEMLGNWSLGDYFKIRQLKWFFEFLTDKDKGIGLQPDRLYVTVFSGDENHKVIKKNGEMPALGPDVESINIWRELLNFNPNIPVPDGEEGFDPKVKIYTYSAKENWWSRAGVPEDMPPGEIGGPDSEVFYDLGAELGIHEQSPFKNQPCHLNCDCGRFLEIGNSVFMQYEKQKGSYFKELPKKNVDFGGGLERIAAASQNKQDIFQTDLFTPVIKAIEQASDKKYEGKFKVSMRVIADHLRAATFMIAQGIEPSNKIQGYVVRRLLRRAAVKMHTLKGGLTPVPGFQGICYEVIRQYGGVYFEIAKAREVVGRVLVQEMDKFAKSLDRGLKVIEKQPPEKIDARFAFDLFQTYGFPFEITQELVALRGKTIEKAEFDRAFKKHQQLSRKASAGMFKGGLADQSEATIKLHTATHLIHQSLRKVLGSHVRQEGSNITAERLRFDFSHPKALTDAEIKKVENLINQKIKENLPVHKTIEDKDEALKSGALAFFKETYPDKVSVYTIGKNPKTNWFSKELCGGPHLKSTGEIGSIKITKQQSIGTGIRRIYAILDSRK